MASPLSNPIQTNTKITDEELLCLPPQEIIKLYRRLEEENIKLLLDHGALVKELNRNMQAHMLEVKDLKENARKHQMDNKELRELCCFLDDGRKLAHEWRKFGQHTAQVMQQAVASYRSKLQKLETKQKDLIRDNLELKELCLYLDDERGRLNCPQCGSLAVGQDEGSSSSTLPLLDSPPPPAHSVLNEEVLRYIRNLEQQAREKHQEEEVELSRPTAVTQAMKVLEVRDQLEGLSVSAATEDRLSLPDSSIKDSLEDSGCALLKEMCNVVWRKLEEPAAD